MLKTSGLFILILLFSALTALPGCGGSDSGNDTVDGDDAIDDDSSNDTVADDDIDDSADDDTVDDTSDDTADDTGDDDLGPTEGFVTIAHGTFTMGSPEEEPGRGSDETQHEVTLTRDFEIKSTETTHADIVAVFGWDPSYYVGCGDDCPVEWMNWYDAAAYADEFSESKGVTPCYSLSNVICQDYTNVGSDYMSCMNDDQDGIWSADLTVTAVNVYECEGFRLPTESEWEYAARAGAATAYHDGLESDDGYLNCQTPWHVTEIAYYCGEGLTQPQLTQQKIPNAWDLYDMSGNVWEWTWDVYDVYPDGSVSNPTGPASGDKRTARGGAWTDGACALRSANRGDDYNPSSRASDLGFRLARTMPE